MLKCIIFMIALIRVISAQCDLNCINCDSINKICKSCGNNTVQLNGKCLQSCPASYFNQNNACQSCSLPCRECETTSTNCLTCQNALQFVLDGQCLTSCPTNTIPTYNEKQSYCSKCNAQCNTCLGNTDNCSSCQDTTKSLYLGACIDICPQGSFSKISDSNPSLKVCSYCIDNCQSCKSSTTCVQCMLGYFLLDGSQQCVKSCPQGFYQDYIYRLCYRTSCPQGMFDVTFSNDDVDNTVKYSGVQCSNTCPKGYFIDSTNNKCIKCNTTCNECTGPLQSDCLVCHQTCLTCAGSRFDQCLSCTNDRQLYQKFNQAVGECVCNSSTTEQLKDVCENSDESQKMKNALTGLTATNFILSVLISFFTQNSIFALRYIDFSQTLSYLGYVTFKYPLQMDRILKIYDHFNIGYLLPKPTQFADSIVISNQILQNNPYDSQLEYSGNPLFFVNERVPFLIINCFSYLIIYIICVVSILSLRFIVYPITQNEKVKKISEKLPHTILLNIIILTSQEMITHTFIQFTNIKYKSNTGISVISTIVAVIFSLIIIGVLGYLSYRTKRKLDFEMEEEAFDMRNKLVRQIKQQNGLPCHFQLAIFIRKIFFSIAVAFLYNYPKAQAAIFLLIQVLFLAYFFLKQPFSQSKFKVIVQFIEITFTFFSFMMLISVFLDGEGLTSLFTVFGGFLIMFQCVVCIIGAYYFLMIAIKLIKLREILEMQQLQKQYDAVKKLQYQDQQNQKQANFFSEEFPEQGIQQQRDMSHNKSSLSISQFPADNSYLSNGFKTNGFQSNLINNQTNMNNTSFQAGNNSIMYKTNQANESIFLHNQSILDTKTIDASSSSPVKGLHQIHNLSYLNQVGKQDASLIKKTQLRKLLPPISQISENQPQNGTSNILEPLQKQKSTASNFSETINGNSILQKRTSMPMETVQENTYGKNNEYIKKKIHQLKNMNNSELSPSNFQIIGNNEDAGMNKDQNMEQNQFQNGSIPNTSKLQIGSSRDQVIDNSSTFSHNQIHALQNISQRSETMSFTAKPQKKTTLIYDVDIEEEDQQNEFENNNTYSINKNNVSKHTHFISENPENQSPIKNKNKEITILS